MLSGAHTALPSSRLDYPTMQYTCILYTYIHPNDHFATRVSSVQSFLASLNLQQCILYYTLAYITTYTQLGRAQVGLSLSIRVSQGCSYYITQERIHCSSGAKLPAARSLYYFWVPILGCQYSAFLSSRYVLGGRAEVCSAASIVWSGKIGRLSPWLSGKLAFELVSYIYLYMCSL